jgi:hypothetical protein
MATDHHKWISWIDLEEMTGMNQEMEVAQIHPTFTINIIDHLVFHHQDLMVSLIQHF